MGVIKNISKLMPFLDGEAINKLETGAQMYLRHSRIEFKVLKADGEALLLEVRQSKSPAENYLDQKELINRTKDLFGSVGVWTKIDVHASAYEPSPVDIVDTNWIKSNMLAYKVSLKMLVAATGIDKASLSAIINGHVNLSQPTKAMFFYYFKSLN